RAGPLAREGWAPRAGGVRRDRGAGKPARRPPLRPPLVARRPGALLRRPAVLAVEVEGAVHEGHVRKCLREVAQLPPRLRIPLLTEQAEVVPERQQPVKERLGLVEAALEGEVVHEPEGAGEERALAGGQAVDAMLLVVTRI